MKQLHYWIGIAILLASCTPSKDPGVIGTTKNARWVKGNAIHFQMRHDVKMKRKAEKLKGNN